MKKTENFIRKKIGNAIGDYDMIHGGDRILLAVSGGKDSLCLLHMLKERQSYSPVKYEIFPVHFSTREKNREVIEKYLKEHGFSCTIINPPKERVLKNEKKNPCFNCSWERRKFLFRTAEKLNCNKIALAHHLDDIIQTTLMNICMMGQVSTMPAKLSIFEGRTQLIRPLAYVPESAISEYAKLKNFPELPVRCRYSGHTNRAFMAGIIDRIEKRSKDVRKNIFYSLRRIKTEYLI